MRILSSLVMLTSLLLSVASARERVLIDSGWRFHLGDPGDVTAAVTTYQEIGDLSKLQDINAETVLQASRPDPVATHAGEGVSYVLTNYNDSAWRGLDLPHDWVVELPFTSSGDVGHGSKATTGNTIAWYRHTFTLPAGDAGKVMWLEFDGIYRNALIWLNGHCIGRDVSGYAPISFDVTPYVNPGGTNVLVVRVDATRTEGWFYEGAGIYRHVWLEKADPVHVAHWGTYVATTSLTGPNATITVQTTVTNQSAVTVTGSVTSAIQDAGSNPVTAATAALTLTAGQGLIVTQTLAVANANLWSLQSPYLYNLVSTVSNATVAADVYQTPFGVRTVRFDATNGVFINGQHVEIQGMCNHQDHAGVGSALPDRLQYFRIERLKQMGVNAYRTSHNAPTEEMLEACDRLGMLVLDETRRVGYDTESLGQLQRMILRDRNHPSVFCWSLANEEWTVQGTAAGQTVMLAMQNLAHALDSTRLCTAAINGSWGGSGFTAVLDVQGFNYNLSSLDSYHPGHSRSNIIGTETASTVTTRGIYTNDAGNGYVASYDIQNSNVGWGSPAEVWWPFYDSRPWSSGGFCWTGFDYRGEPTPYGWPCISSHFGIMDTCGFPKDLFYYYQANWTLKPVLHLFPHWNWSTPGQVINVWAYGNCDAVELFLNGTSQGRQTLSVQGHVAWNVAYAAGTLQAIGYLNGQAVMTNTVQTTGAPAAIALIPDRSTILADGRDVSVVTVAVVDSAGRIVPTASNLVNFTVSGGAIIGVGDGDPSSHEADKGSSQRTVFNGLAQVIVQSTNLPGSITLGASAIGLTSTNITITTTATPVAPTIPTGVGAAPGDGVITLSWDVAPGAFAYNVKRSLTSGGPYTVIASNTAAMALTDIGVANLVTYYYVVSAVNGDGESNPSAEVSATPRGVAAPLAPTGLTTTASDAQVSLSWTASSGATSYNVKLSTVSHGSYATVTNVTTTSSVITGLVDGTPYYFVVSAHNSGGDSPDSSETNATPFAFVSGLSAAVVNSQVQLNWNAHAGATGYNVKRSSVSGGPYTPITNNLAGTTLTDTTVNTCQNYYYVVTAIIGGVESAPSSEVSATVPGILPSQFTSMDIGSVGLAGSALYCSGQFTVSGSGTDIWGTSDAFQFVYVLVPITTNCDVRARVLSQQNTSGNAKAAVMIRESLAANSRHALVDVEPTAGIEFLWRTNTGSQCLVSSVSGQTAHNWVRLTRTNNTFRAYWSPDGNTWNQIGTPTNITMATSAYVGLAVTAHNNSALSTSVFDNLSISSLAANTAPVLNPISDVTTNVGGIAVRTAVATDPDLPGGQTLAFSLLSGPASSLTQINPTNAVFSWRPSVSDANTTNLITVKVADNGSPSLSATQSFLVKVNPLTVPNFAAGTWNGGQFSLQVSNSLFGPDYAVQTSSNLVNWSTLVITNSPPMPWSWTDTQATNWPAQFYRIKVGPPLP